MSRLNLPRILARCEEDGDCLVWTGKVHAKNGAPAGTEWVDGKDHYVGVRRRAYEEYHRVTLTKQDVISCSCGNPACLEKKHLDRLSLGEKNKRMHARMDAATKMKRARKMALSMAKNRKVTPEQEAELRASTDGPYVTAKRLGINGVVASGIVRGVRYKDHAATPWSGLL